MSESQQPTQVYNIQDNSMWVKLLEHNNFLDELEHILKGEVLTVVKGSDGQPVEKWIKKYPAMMTTDGVNRICSGLRLIIESKIVAITDLEDIHIIELRYDISQALLQLLVQHSEEFGFRSESELENLYANLKTIITAQLRRSYKGNTLNAFTTSTSVTEQRVGTTEDSKQGILDRLPFNRRKQKQEFQF